MRRSLQWMTVSVCVILMTGFLRVSAQQPRAVKGRLFLQSPATTTIEPLSAIQSLRSHVPYRTYNGTNNNISGLLKRNWGAAGNQLFREMPAQYGSVDPKNAMAGANRPTPRRISNVVIDEPVTTFNGRGLSAFVYVWGQFIDHDMSKTPTDTIEYMPIALPKDETVFTEPIPFYRSKIASGTGVLNQRQQMNMNTAWIDGSMVYGGDNTRATWLRTFKNGKMKMSKGNLLPFNTVTAEMDGAIDPKAPSMDNDNGHTVKTFVAGDTRASEHPGIASLHTLFIREHNRVCDSLLKLGFTNDEQIYQLARKQVGALIEAITYQEFLPAMGVTLHPYRGYNDNARPDIANTFATAGYRVGHTMVADDILVLSNDCEELRPELDLIEAFWNPALVVQYGVEPFLKGFAAHTQYETDTRINTVLRDFLFTSPNDSTRFGIDLGSLNIQRGRDHGLPDYNTVRKFYTGRQAFTFRDITSNDTLARELRSLYGNVNNIDLWIGILAEDHLPGASVGRTMHEILRWQFEKLRDGDYYFYLNDPFLPSKARTQIIATHFVDVIRRNTTLTNLQPNVFFTQECADDSAAATTAKGTAPRELQVSGLK
ncbi:MAG TPA: peroxidase family protein, partial [Chitinophagaceae bacterium]